MNKSYFPFDEDAFEMAKARSSVGSQFPEPEIVTAIREGKVALPTKLAGLEADMLQRLVDVKSGWSVLGFGGKLQSSHFIQQFMLREIISYKGQNAAVGAAIRWIAEIDSIKVGAKLDMMTQVAASAELGFVRASIRFQVIGIHSQPIMDAIPNPTDLSVDRYAELSEAMKKIKSLMWDEKVVFTPKILAVAGDFI